MLLRIGAVEGGVGDLDRQLARTLHRVAGVDRQVQHRVLELRRIDVGVPQPARDHGFEFHRLADRAPQHVFEPQHELAGMDDARLERLAPAEGEQVLGQLGAAVDGIAGIRQALVDGGVTGQALADQMQIARDDLQQVVEVVCDAARQLADGFHLLRLAQRIFHLQAVASLLAQGVGGLDRAPGSLQRDPADVHQPQGRRQGDGDQRQHLFLPRCQHRAARHAHGHQHRVAAELARRCRHRRVGIRCGPRGRCAG